MNLKKRTLLLLLLPLLILLTGGGVLYFFMVHRFKDSLKYIVNKESRRRYSFDAGDAQLSVWNKTIVLKESVLYSPDSINADVTYRIRIHEIYFSLASWRELLFNKKIVADSLSIESPAIELHVYRRKGTPTPVDFRPSDLLTYLEKTLAHFNVRSFTLKDASFTYEGVNEGVPLQVKHVNLALSNFIRVNNEDSHLLGSDKVGIYVGRSHWVLPNGQQEIDFSRLTFDSKGQRFELDSFSFYQKAAPGKGELRLRGDKFFFTSRHLPAIYQKDELLLDTLICVNPVLTSVNKGHEEPLKDSLTRVSVTGNLFKRIQVQFVSVIDGQLNLQKDGRTENTATRKANVSIYNLSLNPEATPALHTDSIRINLKKLEFITKDSLFRLGIEEFSIRENDVLFKNVSFGPTAYNHSDKEVLFTAPSLLLKGIRISDLLQKRLKASEAELYQPLIVLVDRSPEVAPVRASAAESGGTSRKEMEAKVIPAISARKLALFYRSLHGMSELIDAPHFMITDGAARYEAGGAKPMQVSITGVRAHVLLNQLFVSDSLVDIKQAIPELRVGELKLSSNGTYIKVLNYQFDGVRRTSRGEQLQVAMAGGAEIRGNGIYWKVFDWDVFQKTRAIQIDSLHIDKLAVRTSAEAIGGSGAGKIDSLRELPVIRIGRLTVKDLLFDGGPEKGALHFNAQKLEAEGISSSKRLVTWDHIGLHLTDIVSNGNSSSVRVSSVDFDNKAESVIKGVEVEMKGGRDSEMTGTGSKRSGIEAVGWRISVKLSVPLVRMKVNWSSSDFRQLVIPLLAVDRAALNYTRLSAKDTLVADANVALRVTDLHAFKGAGQDRSAGKAVRVGEKKWQIGEVALDLQQADIRYSRDSMLMTVGHLAGSFDDKEFIWPQPGTFHWQRLAEKTILRDGSLYYKGKGITVEAAALAWNPSGNSLRLTHFSVLPLKSLEETFKSAAWQRDYITVKGESLTLTGIQPERLYTDSLILVKKILLDGVAISASRDKNMPFRHGIEKPMPTKLINRIPLPVKVDSLVLSGSNVVYNELSAKTHQWSRIPFEELNAVIVNVSNRKNQRDTLQIIARAQLLNGRIRPLSYREAYGDSLSAFVMSSHLSPMDLTAFSPISIPMGNVSVISGHADTLYASWEGNKYAAMGTLDFFYNGLRIRVLDQEDINKRAFLPVLKTVAANLILPNRNRRASAIFVERDREKFVFNYWVKALASGALTTVGIKKNSDYRKKYEEKHGQYSLPTGRMDNWKK